MSLEIVERFEVPEHIVRETEDALKRAGLDGYELFVLWSGVASHETFVVKSVHVPEQTSYKTRDGLLVRVEGPALHVLNVWLYEHDETLAVQVHAHPKRAYHSKTDDSFPIATLRGSLSIVAADFCRRGLMSETTACYRLTSSGWVSSRSRAPSLLRVV